MANEGSYDRSDGGSYDRSEKLGDDLLRVDAVRFRLEVDQDSMAKDWRRDGANVFQRYGRAAVQHCPRLSGQQERLPEQVLAAGIMDQSSLMVYAARRDT